MVPEDVPSAHALLTAYLKQFKLAPQLSEEEFAHWLLPREGVVDCFVVKDKEGKVRWPVEGPMRWHGGAVCVLLITSTAPISLCLSLL